ncbi:MAG TPA: hypothetical protein VFV66_10110, partial [Nonomuraea sp.]|nr:hypothetical protein [Nonomuraea sp.]
ADRFIKGTLRPLLDVAARHRDTVYAFEIVNEPYWCVAPVTGSLFGRAVNRDRFRAFLSACVEAVNKAGLPSTIGHRYHRDSADYFSGIPVTRPQFHYYAHSLGRDALPNLAGAPAPRPFLGEFGAITPGEIITLGHHARNARDGERLAQIDRMELTSHLWPAARGSDAVPAAVLRERLDLLASMGYELAVIWPNVIHADPTRDELKLDEERLKQVRAFADRHRPARPR